MPKLTSNTYPITLVKSVLVVSLLALTLIVVSLTSLFNYQSRQVNTLSIKKSLVLSTRLFSINLRMPLIAHDK